MPRRLAGLLVVLALTGARLAIAEPVPDLAAAEAAFTQGLKAREGGDLAGYRAGIERAAELLPDNSRLLYRLAGARLLAGDKPAALEALGRQVSAGFLRDPSQDPDFATLASDPSFLALVARMRALTTPLVASTVAFEIPERDLLVEGIAFDPATRDFFVSSVRQSKILKRSAEGKWERLAAFDGSSSGSALGIVIDAKAKRLWVAAAGFPHGGAAPELLNRGSAIAVDLTSGKSVPAFGRFESGQSANDLALAADGSVFVSDPEGKGILHVRTDGTRRVLASAQGLRSPGGLALSADGKLLYVADWSNGLAVVEIASGKLSWIRPPAGTTVLGIDGLLRHGGDLIAIQNGVVPARITRFQLAADGRALASGKVLERAVPEWDEPTLGVLVDGELFYVAASQWPRYGEDGKPTIDLATLPFPTVRRLPL